MLASLRRLRTWYKLHKWLSIVTGIAIVFWLVSGILMAIPAFLPGATFEETPVPQTQPDFTKSLISPAAIVARWGEAAPLDDLQLRQVGAELVYVAIWRDGSTRFFSALDGNEIEVTAETAVSLLQTTFATSTPIIDVTYLERYSLAYLYGDLPVYRVRLDDRPQTHLFISPVTGSVTASNRVERTFLLFESIHTFAFFHTINPEWSQLPTLLLWVSIGATFVTVVIGAYLALPHRRRARSRQGFTGVVGWLRKIKSWYTVHRWLAVGTGLLLAMWLVTGITLTWYVLFPPPAFPLQTVSYENVQQSPATAARAALEATGKASTIRQIGIKSLLDQVVFEVTLNNGWVLLIDARSGAQVDVTPELAAALAQQRTGLGSEPQVTQIAQHSIAYPYGPAPVYLAAFDDRRATHVYVVPGSGQMWQNDRWARARTLLGSLHTFDALRLVVKSTPLITVLLISAALLTLVMAVTGYYLALPARWQLITRRKSGKIHPKQKESL